MAIIGRNDGTMFYPNPRLLLNGPLLLQFTHTHTVCLFVKQLIKLECKLSWCVLNILISAEVATEPLC